MDAEIIDGTVGDVPYKVLRTGDRDGLPLVVLLHGAFSSAERLVQIAPLVERECVVVCASTPTVGGFYIGEWETLVAEVLPRHVRERFGTDPGDVSLVGASMGGYGALKIAFREPHRWRAVAATSPALLGDAPGPRNTLSVLGHLRDAMATAGWERESVLHLLRANADAIRESGLPIMLRCGDRDVFALHDGTERLHRALWDLDVAHDYHLVRDADHGGPEAEDSARAALAFVAAARRTHEAGEVDELRAVLAPERDEAARRDPDTYRRYGRL